MKKFYLFSAALLIIAAFSVTNVMGNVKIQQKHKGMKKDGKAVNCVYCHGTNANKLIEKKAGQNLAQLQKGPTCVGAGCHK
ncbi:MAG: hypothetical protein A2176_10850 [Spirochaetes bacterium RBG_13_51_14]|nr:MAG: hypothetical protein A2176_10850 [Spirochaetes bacterium RBG_13_51_14]